MTTRQANSTSRHSHEHQQRTTTGTRHNGGVARCHQGGTGNGGSVCHRFVLYYTVLCLCSLLVCVQFWLSLVRYNSFCIVAATKGSKEVSRSVRLTQQHPSWSLNAESSFEWGPMTDRRKNDMLNLCVNGAR